MNDTNCVRIYLDDRLSAPLFDRNGEPYPEGYWTEVQTAEEAIKLIDTGQVEFIDFDHDLGRKLSGYDVAKHVEQLAVEGSILPIEYHIHSGNPVGAGNIDAAMKNAWKHWNRS